MHTAYVKKPDNSPCDCRDRKGSCHHN